MLPITAPDFMPETEIASVPANTELEVYVPLKYRKDRKRGWILVRDPAYEAAVRLTDEGLSQYKVALQVSEPMKKMLEEIEEYCPSGTLRKKVVHYLVENRHSLVVANKGPLSILGVSYSQMQTLAKHAVGEVIVIDITSFRAYVRSCSGTWLNGERLFSRPKNNRYLVLSEEN